MQEIETVAVDIERAISVALRVVFWTLFVVYMAVLAVGGWAFYIYVLLHHRIPLSDNNKDALIVGLVVIVLATILAAITRDQLLHVIFHRARQQQVSQQKK